MYSLGRNPALPPESLQQIGFADQSLKKKWRKQKLTPFPACANTGSELKQGSACGGGPGGARDTARARAHPRRHSRAHLRPCHSPGCNHPVTTGARRAMPRRARGSLPGSRITRGSSRAWRAHRPRSARLPHSARSSAQCAAHGLARVQTAFSTSRTSEVPADLRMGES